MDEAHGGNEAGYTLIELMIVIAIIGILSAIAFAQFTSYRDRSFNAATESALYTARLAESALYTDYQAYGSTVKLTGTPSTASGVLLNDSGYIATSTLNQEQSIALSHGVRLLGRTTASRGAATVTAKHDKGNRFYAIETDVPGLYYKSGAAGTPMLAGDAVAATDNPNHSDAVTAGYMAR
ncbi:MAG TPA: prepilin-type N-terminal cleavage/methylation domain-containing protein [Mariprofundaceae bacterium]|nr:prepilin-type N-terminal cleavage/methylation domain-containing protein [Mariprofundaceae bacterium]